MAALKEDRGELPAVQLCAPWSIPLRLHGASESRHSPERDRMATAKLVPEPADGDEQLTRNQQVQASILPPSCQWTGVMLPDAKHAWQFVVLAMSDADVCARTYQQLMEDWLIAPTAAPSRRAFP